MTNGQRRLGSSFFEGWGNALKYKMGGWGVESGRKPPALHGTFRRKPDRLFLAGCAPAEPASASPAEKEREGAKRESQEDS